MNLLKQNKLYKKMNMQTMNFRNQLKKLGYGLTRHVKDAFGRKWLYKTFPIASGGPTNYFNNITDIERYVRNVELIRSWQN